MVVPSVGVRQGEKVYQLYVSHGVKREIISISFQKVFCGKEAALSCAAKNTHFVLRKIE